MSYLLKTVAIIASLLVMAGCGVLSNTTRTDVSGYPYRHTDFDYKYAWKTTATDNGLLIEGALKNVRYAFINSVQMEVNVLNKDGKIVATSKDYPMPQQTRESEVCFFSLMFKDVKPVPGDILRFQVHYTGNEGGNKSGVDWYSSFKADALTGTAILPQSKKTDGWW